MILREDERATERERESKDDHVDGWREERMKKPLIVSETEKGRE